MTAAELIEFLRARGLTVATAESLTGGRVCAELTTVPGSSAVVRGGVISYATDVKTSVLGVPADLLAREGAVHPAVASAMASGVCRVLGADVGLATTGVAGPSEQDGQSVGTVHIAVALTSEVTGRSLRLAGDRESIRTQTVLAVIDLAGTVVANLRASEGSGGYGGSMDRPPLPEEAS